MPGSGKDVVGFLALIGGARREAVALARNGTAQVATLGAILVVTAIIAAFTGGYAVHQVFLGSPFAVPVAALGGVLWASLVFCIDRSLILGIDRSADARRLALQVLVRIPWALVVALVMSTPFILRICDRPIRLELRREAEQLWRNEVRSLSEATGLPEIRKAISELKASRDAQRQRLLREPESFRYHHAVDELRLAEDKLRSLRAALEPRILAARREIVRLEEAQNLAVTGQLDSLRRQVADWQAQIGRAQSEISKARRTVDQAVLEWETNVKQALDSAQADLSKIEPVEARTTELVAKRSAEAEKELADLLRGSLVNQLRALRRITSDAQNPDAAAVRQVQLGMHLLFIIVELTPIFIKVLARPTTLDAALQAVEFVEKERVNNWANAEAAAVQRAAQVAAAVDAAALQRLENDLLQKVAAAPVFDVTQLEQVSAQAKLLAGRNGNGVYLPV